MSTVRAAGTATAILLAIVTFFASFAVAPKIIGFALVGVIMAAVAVWGWLMLFDWLRQKPPVP